ncbi:MAG: RNA polymerase sigma factor SigJ [Roseibium sp.]
MATSKSDMVSFEKVRPQLLGLAYRMLGSMADAEDAVQDTFVKWQAKSGDKIHNPDAWLTTVCTNRCLDLLKSAHKKRVDYVGPWIPEPLQTETASTPESDLAQSESLTTAFLLLMERLSPKERAAYLLHEIFGRPYAEVAATLEINEPACRKLVSRAGKHVQSPAARFVPKTPHQDRFLDAFMGALETGSTEVLAGLLSENVRFRSDGGGKTAALGRILYGYDEVSKYTTKILSRLWDHAPVTKLEINGVLGLAIFDGSRFVTAMVPGYAADGKVEDIFIIRNPDKLQRMTHLHQHDLRNGGLWN